jgi:hypothetical protein
MDSIKRFEARHNKPDAGALFAWAAWAVDCLHYLDDVDRAFDVSLAPVGGHKPDVVDAAHARWATSTCITALDLCAAALARAFCGHKGLLELGLRDFDTTANQSSRKLTRLSELPPATKQWVSDLLADPDYEAVKTARNSLTHSRVKRHFTLHTSAPPQRLQLEAVKATKK